MVTNNTGYQTPPNDIATMVNAAPTPGASLSPSGEWMLLLEKPNLPSIEEVAQPELRLAGIRINPRTNGSSRPFYYNGFKIKSLKDFKEKKVNGLPSIPKIENVSWSPQGDKIAFTNTVTTGLELWLIDLAKATAQKLHQLLLMMRSLDYLTDGFLMVKRFCLKQLLMIVEMHPSLKWFLQDLSFKKTKPV